jgi:hypothetical protein
MATPQSEPDDDTAPPSALRRLQQPDPLALIFNPVGLGGPMTPATAAEHQAAAISGAVLAEVVPKEVRENFERARKLHLYGVLEYEFFTAAPEYALMVLEAALRVRFLTYYDHEIPVIRRATPDTLRAEDFEAVRGARKTRLRRPDGSAAQLPIHLTALLAWSRRERLLPGRRSRVVDRALVEMRNHSVHPTGRTIEAPPGSSSMLRTVAEYINQLWGEQTAGGRHFPGPLARRPRVVALAADGSASRQFSPEQIFELPADERDWTFAVFLAAEEEELTLHQGGLHLAHAPGFQATLQPCELLWSGSRQELIGKVRAGYFEGCADTAPHLDRLFLIRADQDCLDLARSPEDLLSIPEPPEGHWYAVIADTPHEALAHVRDHEPSLEQGPAARVEDCPHCFVEVSGRLATTAEALEYLDPT